MTNVIQISRAEREKACVVALHCSLGSGRQWKTLADELGRSHRFFAPDISGYGANGCALDLPLTLAEEIRAIGGTLNDAEARSIRAESRLFKFRYRSPAHFLDVFKTYYGPVLKAFAALEPAKQEELHNDLNALIVRMNRSGDGTMVVPSEYLEVVITKR